MRYIIALLAVAPNLYIQEAQKEFGSISQDYLLSENSLPQIKIWKNYEIGDEICSEPKIAESKKQLGCIIS